MISNQVYEYKLLIHVQEICENIRPLIIKYTVNHKISHAKREIGQLNFIVKKYEYIFKKYIYLSSVCKIVLLHFTNKTNE